MCGSPVNGFLSFYERSLAHESYFLNLLWCRCSQIFSRRHNQRAIIAIARMILTAVFQMLSTGERWNPSDLYKTDMPQALVEKQKAKAIKYAKKLLLREGIIPESQLAS